MHSRRVGGTPAPGPWVFERQPDQRSATVISVGSVAGMI